MRKLIVALFIVAAIFVVPPPGGNVFAGKVSGVSLNAQAVVDSFNSMNGGTGYNVHIWPSGLSGAPGVPAGNNYFGDSFLLLQTKTGNDNPNLSAYANSDNFYSFFHFMDDWRFVQRNAYHGVKLNYTNGKTLMATGPHYDNNVAMSVGAAYLYMMFATTEHSPDYDVMKFADTLAMLSRNSSEYLDWENNSLLQSLLEINGDKDYWLSDYDPDAYYDEIGNYSVFYMGLADGLDGMFYIAAAAAETANPYAAQTPEPTAMLLLGTGLIALPFARRFWQNRQKK